MDSNRIHEWAKGRGLACRIMDPAAIGLVRRRLEGLAAGGALDPGFVRGSLSEFRYLEGRRVREPRGLVMLAVPRTAHAVSLEFEEGRRDYYFPPTYVEYSLTFDVVLGWFRENLGLGPREADIVHAPLKSLAAMAGLIRYGRNNIGYVAGFGSFVQLVGIVTPFALDPDGEPRPVEDQVLERCRDCRACLNVCRTGAIGLDRFLLRGERCYVLHSESRDPIPESMTPPSTDCLIGCLKCQEVCPENKGLLKKVATGLSFDRRETDVLLAAPEDRPAEVWREIESKFAALRTTEKAGTLARNLRWLRARTA
jgi:epoxyqueuosine reductase